MASETSLVTGGAGFIGSHVTDELIRLGHRVIVLDDMSGGFTENVNPAAILINGSVTDTDLVDEVFTQNRIDHVYHLAAYAAEGLSHFIRRFNYTNNVVGSMTVLNAALRHKCRCFVFTSSIAVYGAGQVPMVESLAPRPVDPYGIGKYAVELDLEAARNLFGLNYIVFRPHNVYGERQNIGDPYRNVVGIFMNQILQGQPCTVFGDGMQTRAFTHISDIAPVIAKSVYQEKAFGQVFNIGADTPYSVTELVRMVQEAMGVDTGIQRLAAREEVQHAFSDHSKCETYFAYRARTSLRDGLTRMVAWVRTAGARTGQPFGNLELTDKLPLSWSRLCTKAER